MSCSQRVGALVFWLMLKGALAVSRSQSRMISSTTGTRLTGHHVTIRTPTPTIRAGIGAYPNTTTTTNDHHAASNATSTMRKRPTHASKCHQEVGELVGSARLIEDNQVYVNQLNSSQT
ncbi:hypothetical protein C8R48DRAFT_667618 [Suillus tomentosus]|nr:hypothetical protein C8R48DRAFT_667618 [Suillus tomentosus]